MAAKQTSKNSLSQDAQLHLLYGDDSRFKYWETHLFNEVYLKRDLLEKHSDRWGASGDNSFQHFMNILRNLAAEYKGREKELMNWSETETINSWVKHVLDGLGWKDNCTGVQNPFLEETSFRYDGKTYRTDILMVDHPKDKNHVNSARGDDKVVEARSSVIMPVEVKYWQRLEEFRQGRKEENKRRDVDADDLERTATPNEQIVQYMKVLKKDWGILTDGAKWRLFNSELSGEDANRYYEFNLYSLIESMNTEETEADRHEVIEAAKYFFHFFSKETFYSKDDGEESFVSEVLRYSKKYVNKVEEDLKDRFVKAMNIACNGFYHQAKSGKEKPDLSTIRNISESSLFNILFIKSLESRGILPMNSTDYKKISLSGTIDKIERFDPEKEDILNLRELDRAFRKGNGNSFSYKADGFELHERIVRLTMVIHDGSKKDNFGFEIAGFKESIFTESEWTFFKSRRLTNDCWVKILFQLGYAESESLNRKYQQIPYSYFTPRQLGSIYESFLEFKLELAETDMIFENRQWKPAPAKSRLSRVQSDKITVSKGDLFFTADNEERQATGSYYTPHHIVDYISKNSIGPVVLRTKSAKEILEVKVCDPSMGSGHFLASALSFLTEVYMNRLVEEGLRDDRSKNEIMRLVLDKCIFGVDKNPRAVKLAQLSLWLVTASVNTKLERLNDQLRDADSLCDKTVWSKFPKFDAVVGNPPYAKVSREYAEKLDDKIKGRLGGELNLYKAFITLGWNILKPLGRLGYISPADFLSEKHSSGLRKFIIDSFAPKIVINLPYKFFPGVSLEPAIYIFQKDVGEKDFSYLKEKHANLETFRLDSIKFQKVTTKSVLEDSEHRLGNFVAKNEDFTVAGWELVSLKDLIDVRFGFHPGKGKDFTDRKTPTSMRVLEGRDIGPYEVRKSSKFLEFKKSDLENFALYRQPKIVMQRIRTRKMGPDAVWIKCAIDTNGCINFASTNGIYLKDSKFSLAVISALLNHPDFNARFKEISQNVNITANDLYKMVVPYPTSKATIQKLEKLVEQYSDNKDIKLLNQINSLIPSLLQDADVKSA